MHFTKLLFITLATSFSAIVALPVVGPEHRLSVRSVDESDTLLEREEVQFFRRQDKSTKRKPILSLDIPGSSKSRKLTGTSQPGHSSLARDKTPSPGTPRPGTPEVVVQPPSNPGSPARSPGRQSPQPPSNNRQSQSLSPVVHTSSRDRSRTPRAQTPGTPGTPNQYEPILVPPRGPSPQRPDQIGGHYTPTSATSTTSSNNDRAKVGNW